MSSATGTSGTDDRTEPDRRAGISFAKKATPSSSLAPSTPEPSDPAPSTVQPPAAEPSAAERSASEPASQLQRPAFKATGVQLVVGIAVAVVTVIIAIAATAVWVGGRRTTATSGNLSVSGPTRSLSSISPGASTASTPAIVSRGVAPTSAYQTYSDSRYGFSFEIPNSYQRRAPLGSSDTAAFQSPDGNVIITVFERPGQPADDPAQAETSAKARFIDSGGQPTYLTHGASSYIVSGWTADRNVYYEFCYLGSSGEGGFTFTYPAATKSVSDTTVTHSYRTFEPGSL